MSYYCLSAFLALQVALLADPNRSEEIIDSNKPTSFEISRNCLLIRERWEPFSFVVETREGMRLPVIGKVKIDGDKISLRDARLTVEIVSFDLRPYWKNREAEIARLSEKFGKKMTIAGISGIPQKERVDYLLVTGIEVEGKALEIEDSLTSVGLVRIAE